MNVRFEVIVEASCCGRQRPLSTVELTVRQLGLVLWGTYRCKDSEACEGLEREVAAEFWQPYVKVLAN